MQTLRKLNENRMYGKFNEVTKCRRCRRMRHAHHCADKCIADGCCIPCMRKLFKLFQSLHCEEKGSLVDEIEGNVSVRFDLTGTT